LFADKKQSMKLIIFCLMLYLFKLPRPDSNQRPID
jgi:hypothetical protein